MGLSVDANIDSDTDLFGKVVSDLQSNVSISGNNITGSLKYVNDYTGFSGNIAEQSGNYLVIHANIPEIDDATITVTLTNPSVLDEDGIIVLRVTDNSPQTIQVVASKDGYASVRKVYNISDLVLES